MWYNNQKITADNWRRPVRGGWKDAALAASVSVCSVSLHGTGTEERMRNEGQQAELQAGQV